MTTFALGGTYNTTTLKSDTKSEKATRTTLDYLAVGLPFGKIGVGFGLIPYSSVGYKYQFRQMSIQITDAIMVQED
jgi:hypothetical protein